MKVIKEWFQEGLGKIICSEERYIIEEGDERYYLFGRKEKLKLFSNEEKYYPLLFSLYPYSDETLEDIFYNRTEEQQEEYKKLTAMYHSFLESIENIEKKFLEYYKEEFEDDLFLYYSYYFIDEDLPIANEPKDLYDYFTVVEIDIFPEFYQILMKSKLIFEDIVCFCIPEYHRENFFYLGINLAYDIAKPVSLSSTWI